MLVMSLLNVSKGQNKTVRDSLIFELYNNSPKEVRYSIDTLKSVDKKIELKKELGNIMREARKPKEHE